jgi:hypothetical protein
MAFEKSLVVARPSRGPSKLAPTPRQWPQRVLEDERKGIAVDKVEQGPPPRVPRLMPEIH